MRNELGVEGGTIADAIRGTASPVRVVRIVGVVRID